MEKQNKLDILEMLGNYGHYVCNVGQAMDKAGISISKMRRLTGLNHEIVKKYYEDRVVRIDKAQVVDMTFNLLVKNSAKIIICHLIIALKSDVAALRI